MGDNLEADAKLKTHSTVSQAIDVGERSKAKFTLLTHFSNRYPRFPDKSDELMAAKNVGIAFDNVVVGIYCIIIYYRVFDGKILCLYKRQTGKCYES